LTTLTEPFFVAFDADVGCLPIMTLKELVAGADEVREILHRYE
jgi:hypothetical protein